MIYPFLGSPCVRLQFLMTLGLSVFLPKIAVGQISSATNPNSLQTVMTATLREAIDTTISPCEDFEQYANGGWRANNKEKKIDRRINAIFDNEHRTDIRLIEILEAARQAAPTTNDPTTRILGTFYASCLAADSLPTLIPLTPGGRTLPTTREAKCLSLTDQFLQPALSQAFIVEVMTPTIATYTRQWLNYLKETIHTQIQGLSWVQDSMKQKALIVLDNMDIRITLSPPVVDYSEFMLSPTDYEGNQKNIPLFEKQRQKKETAGKSLSEEESKAVPYHFMAQAFRGKSTQENAFAISVSAFQLPFFDAKAESATNYASLGYVLSHEILHLMTPYLKWSSTEEGRKRAEVMTQLYTKFDGSGWSTIDEDLADVGGLSVAYESWLQHGRSTAVPLVEGFTPEQRFFLYFSRMWRNPEPRQKWDIRHSSPRARINGVVMHLPVFAKAFGCREGDPMAPPANRRGEIFSTEHPVSVSDVGK